MTTPSVGVILVSVAVEYLIHGSGAACERSRLADLLDNPTACFSILSRGSVVPAVHKHICQSHFMFRSFHSSAGAGPVCPTSEVLNPCLRHLHDRPSSGPESR